MNTFGALRASSYKEFVDYYEESGMSERVADNPKWLFRAISNGNLDVRWRMANRLLDDGIDASHIGDEGVNALHVLFSRRYHNHEEETTLARRLIELGCDVNLSTKRYGTPFHELLRVFAVGDEENQPFYDVLFSLPDLDLHREGMVPPVSVIDFARKLPEKRASVIAQMEEYLRRHSIEEV